MGRGVCGGVEMCEWPCANVSGGELVVGSGSAVVLSGLRGGGGITGVEFEEYGVEAIGTFVFSGWVDLARVVLPSTVVEIGSYAFFKCVSLVAMVFPRAVGRLGDFSFAGCTSLAAIEFSGSSELSVVGRGAFEGCVLLSLRLPPGGVVAGPSAFHDVGCCWNCGELSGAEECVVADEKTGGVSSSDLYWLFSIFVAVAVWVGWKKKKECGSLGYGCGDFGDVSGGGGGFLGEGGGLGDVSGEDGVFSEGVGNSAVFYEAAGGGQAVYASIDETVVCAAMYEEPVGAKNGGVSKVLYDVASSGDFVLPSRCEYDRGGGVFGRAGGYDDAGVSGGGSAVSGGASASNDGSVIDVLYEEGYIAI